jgi:hypothetical protein
LIGIAIFEAASGKPSWVMVTKSDVDPVTNPRYGNAHTNQHQFIMETHIFEPIINKESPQLYFIAYLNPDVRKRNSHYGRP